MLSIDNVSSLEHDLFGVRPSTALPEAVSPDPVVVRVRAKRALKGSITAATVDPRIARSFGLRSLFPELVSIEASRANSARPVVPAALSPDELAERGSDPGLAIADDEDTADFECGPASLVTDVQLRAELAAWQQQLTDQEVALVLWRMQVAHLEENLAFLMSVDTKPRVTMEKAYVLQWMFTEDVVNGIDFRKNHMSFHTCCKACKIDPEEFRLKLLQVDLVRKLLVALHLMCEHELPALRKVAFYADIVGDDRAVPDNSVYQYEGM